MNIDSRIEELGDRLEQTVAAELRAARHAPARRRRRQRRPIIAMATAGLAAAAVATVLVVGSGSGGADPSAGNGAGLSVAHGSATESAYIVKRLKAHLAAGANQGTVMETYSYSEGSVQPDGSVTGIGNPEDVSWFYRAPDDAQFWSELTTGAAIAQAGETGNVVNGKYYSFALVVNHSDKTYSLTQSEKSDPYANDGDNTGPGGGYLTDESGPQQVEAALQSGQATEKGTTTVNGTPAIALLVTEPGDPADQSSYEQLWMYVNAQTDQPLRFINDISGTNDGQYQTGLYVSDWYPSTAANIAKAKDRAIPAGYTPNADASANTGNSGS